MNTTGANITAIPDKYRVTIFIALVAAGLAGNYFMFPIFYNVEFLFGSIFAMLALQFLGLGRGILAAAMIAGYTYFLWNHPYAIVILAAEVAVVGWLMGRRKMGLVLADTIYWLVVGMPLVYLFYHGVMHVSYSNTNIVMIEQAINGIANALVARLIFSGYALRSRSSLTSYREIVYNLLAFFVLCPALIMLAVESRSNYAETDRQISTRLIQDSHRVDQFLEIWLANRNSAIVNLAEMAASRSPQQMQSYLEQAKKSDVNFQYIGLQDKEAKITAIFPLRDEQGQNNIGKNFADRLYIPILKSTLKPMLSELVLGKFGMPRPLVATLAPVVVRGEYDGYVFGVLSLDQIRDYLDKSTYENATLYSLLDKNGVVIMTNRTDQAVMAPFDRGNGTHNPLCKGISQWLPILPSNTPTTERWLKSFYVAESGAGNIAAWKLILEQPVEPLQKTLYDSYTRKLMLLFLMLIGALALAEFLSRRSVATLEKLRLITSDIPVSAAADDKETAWPESGILEANHLINNFRSSFDQNAELEEIVLQRTKEVLQSRLEIVQRLGRASEFRDNETGRHVLRMSHSAALLAKQLGWSKERCELLLYASPMHDLGKIGISDSILLKPGRLTDEERTVMEAHSAIGADILSGSNSELLETARIIALTHHERWDGSGYPQKMAGESIPIEGRIAAIVDVFDALTSERPYKKAWSVEEAVATLRKDSGIHFDPNLVEQFLIVLPDVLKIRQRFSEVSNKGNIRMAT